MKSILSTCLLFVLATFVQAETMSPVGLWKTIDDETGKEKSIIEISIKEGELFAHIVEVLDSNKPKDQQICDMCEGEKKNQPFAGLEIMWGLTDKGDEWSGGQILDPANGKVYKVFLELSEDGQSAKVRGYIGFALIGRTQIWYRQ